MFRRMSPVFLVAACTALAGCAADAPSDGKEVADLRVQLQREQRENEKQREQIAVLERRIAGVAEDVSRVHKTSMEVAASVAPKSDAAATDAAGGGPPAAGGPSTGASTIDAPSMKAYFESEEGKKAFAAAMKVQQDQAEKDRTARAVDGILARLAKDAVLTEDQTKKMKDILGRGAAQFAELRQSLQGGAGFGDPDVRQKFTDLKTNTDNEAKAVLSQTQFDTYQKSMGALFGGFGGPGGFTGRPRGGGQSGN